MIMLSGIPSRAATFVTGALNHAAPRPGPVIDRLLKISLRSLDGTAAINRNIGS